MRLLDQDHAVTRELGLFPVPVEELFALQGEEGCRVLDLACGPGGWAGDVALRLPEAEVIGVDLARAMVRYATMRATSQQRANVRFSVMDITRPFSFPNTFFHYVQGRFLVGFMRPEQWLPLVQECRRVLVPDRKRVAAHQQSRLRAAHRADGAGPSSGGTQSRA